LRRVAAITSELWRDRNARRGLLNRGQITARILSSS
jgi:hypothetical protein